MRRFSGLVLSVASAVILLGNAGCLPENFWADKWGEVVNRSIFGVINAAIGAATNNAVQI
jgi:hypothetical protein